MTKKSKIILILLIITIIIFKEEIYGLIYKNIIYTNISEFVSNTKSESLEKEYNSLKNAYQYDDYLNYNLSYSKILYRNIYNFNDEVTIYLGEKDNLKKDNLVINEKGLVGIIKSTNKSSSIVNLLTNKNTSLSVKINNVYGILKYQDNKMIIDGVTSKDEVNVGDKVYTSDISKYPKDILIGTIKNINYDKYEIEKYLEVESKVDFNSLKYVAVITSLRGEEWFFYT